MSSFDFNKILASIILGIIIILIIGKVGNNLINLEESPQKETAYKIDIPETSSSIITAAENLESIESITLLFANASLNNAEKIYKKCGACHNYEKNSKAKIGPNLWDIVNQPNANAEGFAYSNSLATFGGSWTYQELNNFLYKPKDYIKGTKMNFAGLKNSQDRADLILWLSKNSDNSVSLP